MPFLPDALLLVLSRNLPIKPNANTMMSSSSPRIRTPIERYKPLSLSLVPTCAKNDDHNAAYLYYLWSDNKRKKNTSPTQPAPSGNITNSTTTATAYTPIKIPIQDDPSISPTLETMCTLDTLDTHPLYPTNINNDIILSITIWSQTIVQYRMPIQPITLSCNRSQHPSTAFQYML